MIEQRDSALWFKTNALLRRLQLSGVTNTFCDHCFVNEYPKSGGSWLAQMLGDALNLPFPRNRLPMWRSSILHGHYMAQTHIPKTVLFWRDGRDVAVSWYYHFVVGHSLTSQAAIETVRREAGIKNPEDIEESFLPALTYFLDGPRHPRFTWASFVDRWADDDSAVHVKYEDMKKDAALQLRLTVEALTGENIAEERCLEIAEKYSFSKQTGRKSGEEKKGDYLRKGVTGDWKSHFNPEAEALFIKHAGKQLIKLGYERDNDWIRDT